MDIEIKSVVSCPIPVGNVPTKLFPSNKTICKNASVPSCDGNVPVRLLLYKLRIVKSVMADNSVGMLPLKLFEWAKNR